GDRPDAPSREELRREQQLGYAARALRPRDAAEQDLSGIGAAHQAGRLDPVERESVGAEIGGPEASLEAFGELVCLRLGVARARVFADPRGAPRQRLLRRIDVALHLGERDRSFRKTAVGMEHGVEGILPALVLETFGGGAVILDEAVTILVGRAVNPG